MQYPFFLFLMTLQIVAIFPRSLSRDRSKQVRKSVLFSLGYMSCIHGSSNASGDPDRSSCKLFLGDHYERQIQTMDLLLRGFWCPRCDKGALCNKEQSLNAICMSKVQNLRLENDFTFIKLQSLFFQFLYEEPLEDFQLACVQVLPQILRHVTYDILLETRFQWIECVDHLLLHKIKAVREAFSAEISCFLEDHILEALFIDGEASERTKEQKFLDKVKYALAGTEDPQVLVTILESTAEVMNASGIHGQLFFYSLILFVDQLDNQNRIVRLTASRLMQRSCHLHLNGGFELILSRFFHIRDELYDYLSARLVSRPTMIREFAEAVIGIKTEELLRRMAPFVIPKLVVSHRDDDQALITLNELANHLDTDVVPLIVNWLPKVLAFALLHADGQELSSVLQFYHVQTGSDSKEIFAAALPALLDELLCFPVEGNMDETDRR